MIPFKKLNLGNSYDLLKPLFENGQMGEGKIVAEFEEELAKYVGAKHVIAVSSCTAAIYISCLWEKMHGAKSVSIPSMTMALVPNAILQSGLEISHFNGDVDWVGDRYYIGGTNIIDSAHRVSEGDFEGLPDDTKICYSFYPTKVIGSIDGGAIATNDSEFAYWCKSFIHYGRRERLDNSRNSWEYEVVQEGGKYNWNDPQALIALEQLRRIAETKAELGMVRHTYNEAFDYDNLSDYLYRIVVKDRDGFMEYMQNNGVQCGIHFKPLHQMKPFEHIKITLKDRNRVEATYKHIVSIPYFDLISNEDLEKVIDLVKRWRSKELA